MSAREHRRRSPLADESEHARVSLETAREPGAGPRDGHEGGAG